MSRIKQIKAGQNKLADELEGEYGHSPNPMGFFETGPPVCSVVIKGEF